MKKSHEVLKAAISTTGVKSVASDMGLSQSMIYKWSQASDSPDASGADNPLDRLLTLCRLTNDETPVDWLCQQTGSFRVKNPEGTASADISRSVLDNTQDILKEFSEMLEAVTESYANGQRIDLSESDRIRKEWEELKSVTEQFVCACEQGTFNREEMNEGERYV
jgi:hypothetical protein